MIVETINNPPIVPPTIIDEVELSTISVVFCVKFEVHRHEGGDKFQLPLAPHVLKCTPDSV